MKKQIFALTLCTSLLFVSGCTLQQNDQPNVQPKHKIFEVENSDYTYSYKTIDGDIVLENLDTPLEFSSLGIAVLNKNEKFGLVNQYGEIIVEPIYDYIGSYSEGLYAFFIQDLNGGVKIGYLNTNGEVVIDPIPADIALFSGYTYDYNFHNGIALYRSPKNNKYGYIDKLGNQIAEPMFDWAGPFTGKLAPISQGEKYGYMNKDGVLKIPYKFVFAEKFSDGLAAVYNGEKWGYINEDGELALNYQFGSFEGGDGELIAEPFVDGITAVYLGKGQAYHLDIHKGQFALINKTGQIIGQKYDSIRRINNGDGKIRYFVKINGLEYTLDSKGNRIEE